jgi:GNAT superfamily N-acetyltransferase
MIRSQIMLLEKTTDQIYLPDAPSIGGLTFRLFRDEADYPVVADLMNAGSAADGIEDFVTVEWVKNYLSQATDFDPHRDILLAEVNSDPIALARVRTRLLDDGTLVLINTGSMLPAWRRKGLGRAMQRWAEDRLREIAAPHPTAGSRVFRSFAADAEAGTIALLRAAGYEAVRYGFEMARSFDEPIPDLPLPAGVEVRSVAPEQYRQVYAAINEAFRDHWSHAELTDDDYLRWINDPQFQPHLWQVAWAGAEVAGMVLNFIDQEYNEKFKRLRGWTDPICVRRPWRKQGLAKALIARSLRLLKDRGMTEAGLGVDADNPNGALRLYQSMGFRQTMRFSTYEKPLVVVG